MKIWGYSERGVMNALFYGIVFGNSKTKKLKILFDILEISTQTKELENAEIIIEPSLSKYYGTPDLIILYGINQENVLFIEAKVKTSQIKEQCFIGYRKAYTQQNKIRVLCNKIFELKKKFPKNIGKILKGLNVKGEPRIGDNHVVKKIVLKIIRTSAEPIFKQILPATWKVIRKKFNPSVLSRLEEVFSNNEGQIY